MSEAKEKRSRKAVRAALAAIDAATQGRPLAAALAEALRAEEKLGPQERRAVAMAARAAIRELRRIDLVLARACAAAKLEPKRLPDADRTLLRYLALRVSVEREPAERPLRELALPGPRRPRSLGDDVLAKVAAHLEPADELPLSPDPVASMGVRRSVPDLLAQRMIDELGAERADAVLAALNLPSRLDLRANRLLATREEVALRLAGDGVQTQPLALAPDGLVAADRTGLFGKAHSAGLFEVQDEGSQLIALLCGAVEGEQAIDFCAGSGGKSLALAAAVGRTGKVIACDAVARRLAELPARVRRARAQAIVERAGDLPADEWVGRADVVLVDAPCSGVGSLRREPDLRWRISAPALDGFPATQAHILAGAARFVRPGGRLVYATCSPFRAEDEAVVEAFLEAHRDFFLEDAAKVLPPTAREAASKGGLRVWPDLHGGGAFFAARLTRRGA